MKKKNNLNESMYSIFKINQLKNFLIDNRYWIAYLLLISFFSYFCLLTNFSLHIDEELLITISQANIAWIDQGRWAMYLLNYLLLPNPEIPCFPLLMTLLFSAAGFSIITRILSNKRTAADYLSAPFFLAFPTLYYIYSFNTINYGIGIAFFMSALSIYSFIQEKYRVRLLSVFLASFAFGIYQSMILWLAALFMLYLITRIQKDENITIKLLFSILLKFIIFMGVTITAYVIIEHMSYYLLDRHPATYISNYYQFSLTNNYFIKTFTTTFSQILHYYLGAKSIYLIKFNALFILFITILSGTIFTLIVCKKTIAIKLFGVATLSLLLCSPFTLNLITRGFVPTRVLISIPLIFSGLTFLSFQTKSKIFHLFLFLLIVVCSYDFVLINNKMAFSSYLSWEADKALTIRLLADLDQARPKLVIPQSQKIPLEIVGYYNRPPSELMIQSDTIGSSFYFWDYGNIQRIISVMNIMGVVEYAPASREQRQSIKKIVDNLPFWPNKGSVAFIEGIAVVKFSNYSDEQLKKISNI